MTRSRIYSSGLPPVSPGMKVGLYGGSFNPAHDGHRHVAITALRRLGLDRIWCLVTPGNPLKDISALPTLETRLSGTAQVMNHPKIDITGAEKKAGTRYTAETLDWIQLRTRGIDLVWVMGADNLKQFHKWQRWQDILTRIPVAIIDRPGYSLSPLYATAAHHFAHARIPSHREKALATMACPAWTFLYGPRSNLSSTALRQSAKIQLTPDKQVP
ncbi:nicotinate-nucleotide adenylyltransferase [Cohaesibacter celericrescens]|uniref:Probable nicotinate-nucleotide adenylyltransferase n=1 Tax=Cohaesibacter celericrescens TaxID=2067669 RepID=A0A2N5XPG6_9HYPH|nr:nicotinate-nucleotide adenylyltransferase [Cohaesibacter celericrescens]PLW76416.1 nicotinic acid mononucleotide adenylyltransferase [Cohaesibacter celericrescens]